MYILDECIIVGRGRGGREQYIYLHITTLSICKYTWLTTKKICGHYKGNRLTAAASLSISVFVEMLGAAEKNIN